MCPMWGSFEPRMMMFPCLFMILFCVVIFFIARGCRRQNGDAPARPWWGCCCFPYFRRDESSMNMAEEIDKLKKEIQELKNNLGKN